MPGTWRVSQRTGVLKHLDERCEQVAKAAWQDIKALELGNQLPRLHLFGVAPRIARAHRRPWELSVLDDAHRRVNLARRALNGELLVEVALGELLVGVALGELAEQTETQPPRHAE